jgi:hypothetical protein
MRGISGADTWTLIREARLKRSVPLSSRRFGLLCFCLSLVLLVVALSHLHCVHLIVMYLHSHIIALGLFSVADSHFLF